MNWAGAAAFAVLMGVVAQAQEAVRFEDPALEAAVRQAVGVEDGPLTTDVLAAPGVASLSASAAKIRSLSGIEALTSLQSLDLSLNQIEDVSPLAGLTGLRTLRLHVNAISDLRPLSGLVNLESLYLYKNRIASLEPLAGLSNLRELYASMNQVEDLGPMRGLAHLEVLDLSLNRVEDLSPLAGLVGLNRLLLHGNQIADVSPLSGCTALSVLELHENDVVDAGPLAGVPQLDRLTLSENAIRDVAPLKQLRKLTVLALAGNRIDALDPWKEGLPWGVGTQVDLERNPLDEAARCQIVPALIDRGLNLRSTGSCGADQDGDGLADAYEQAAGTNPDAADSDGDGMDDRAEIVEHRTDPAAADTDGDGMPDGFELAWQFDPRAPDGAEDADGDGVSNALESRHGTNPRDRGDRPRPGKLAVSATQVTLTEAVPWAPLRVSNAGDLELKWRIASSNPFIRVVHLSTADMAAMVESRAPSTFWGLNDAGETVEGGTGADEMLILSYNFDRAHAAEVVVENAEDPHDRAVVSVEVEPRPGADNVHLAAVATPPEGGSVFLDPSGGDYVRGTVVRIGAVPAEGWRFDRWQGGVAETGAANTEITMEQDESLIAFFEPAETGGGFPGCAAGASGGTRTPGAGDALAALAVALLARRAFRSPSRRGTRA